LKNRRDLINKEKELISEKRKEKGGSLAVIARQLCCMKVRSRGRRGIDRFITHRLGVGILLLTFVRKRDVFSNNWK